MNCSPIVLFTYNRLTHTQQTVEALQKNFLASDSDLIIYSDGAKNEQAFSQVNEVREYLKTIKGFKSVSIIERDKNWGLADNIIDGVTEIVNKYGTIIVLEDDMITSQFFLKYMNEALEFYENEQNVISIHGYNYPVKEKLPDTFFLKGADCWGWATWKRGWNLFEPDGKKLYNEIVNKKLKNEFNFYNSYDYLNMLKRQCKGKNNSWAVRWYASAFLKNKLTLYPGKSLINNIGLDGSGTHCANGNNLSAELKNNMIKIGNITIEENQIAKKAISSFFRRNNQLTISVYKIITRILGKR